MPLADLLSLLSGSRTHARLEGRVECPNVFLLAFRSSYLYPQHAAIGLCDQYECQVRRVLALKHNVVGDASDEQFGGSKLEGIPILEFLHLCYILKQAGHLHLTAEQKGRVRKRDTEFWVEMKWHRPCACAPGLQARTRC